MAVSNALRSNITLESIVWKKRGHDGQLLSHFGGIRDLTLSASRRTSITRQAQAVVAGLIAPSGKIRKLKLEDWQLNEDVMSSLVGGLNATSTLESLDLSCCIMDEEASKLFIGYFQQPQPHRPSTLQELRICETEKMFPAHSVANVVKTVLTIPRGVKDATIGTCLKSLRVDSTAISGHYVALFRLLAGKSANRISLESLNLGIVNKCTWDALPEWLPGLVHVRSLTLGMSDRPDDVKSFCRAMKRNGSLQHVHLHHQYQPNKSILEAHEIKVVEACCQRNRFMASFGVQTDGSASNDTSTTGSKTDPDVNGISSNSIAATTTTAEPMYPPLWEASRQIDDFSSRRALAGLLNISQSLGHFDQSRRGDKRLLSE